MKNKNKMIIMLRKSFFFVSLSVIALWSCDKGGTSGQEDEGKPLDGLSVSVESYSSSDGSEGYQLEFKDGDGIGLFAVKDGQVVAEISNLRLNAVGQDGGIVWKSSVEDLSLPDGAVFYAYYPYMESLDKNSVDATAESAEDFFDSMADSWETAKDQSDPEDFYGSTLMIGSGVFSGGILSLSVSPFTQLVVFDFPGKVYHFTNTDYSIPDYEPVPSKTECFGFTPYTEGYKKYFVVNPAVADSLRGTYTDNGEERDWTFGYGFENTEDNCIVCTVGDGLELINHNLQVGDFFLYDGSLLAKDADIMDVLSVHVMGVVFQINPDRIGESEKEALGGTAHALVVSARHSATSLGALWPWFSDYDTGEFDRDESVIGLQQTLTKGDSKASFLAADSDISGYRNTHLILSERAADVENGMYPSFKVVSEFVQETGGPADNVVTTGWFLPSYGQMMDVLRAFSGYPLDVNEYFVDWGNDWYWDMPGAGDFTQFFNDAFAKINEDQKTYVSDAGFGFWTSTQADSETAWNISRGKDFVDTFCENKCNGGYVRPVLAF